MGALTSVPTPKGLQQSSKTKSVIVTYEDDTPDDNEIKRQVASLHAAIVDHGRNYHHQLDIKCPPTEIEIVLLRETVWYPGLSTKEFSHLLYDTRSRRSAITCLISHMVLKNIDFWGPRRQTLLPVSVVGCIQEFTHGDRQTKLTEG